MKKTILVLLVLLLALFVTADLLGQTVGANQIKRKTDGGLAADSANALTLGLKRSGTAPASPVSGQLWLDTSTTPATLKSWNGSTWEIPPTGSANVLADLSSLPASPGPGDIVWISGLKRAIVYDSSDSTWYYLDGTNRRATSTYTLDGNLSSAFLAAPSTAPTLATGTGTSTAGTHVCAVTYFNSTGGETLPGPSSSSVTTTAVQGIAASDIPIGGAGVAGRRVYCSEAGTETPLFLVGTLTDNTTTTLAVGTATNAALLVAAPDVNFSAPIPSGWTFRAPGGNDLTYGGCGSTGTSLLCSAVAFTAAASAATNGVRLTYGVADGSGNWKAQFRVTRARSGFVGTQSVTSYSNMWLSAASANDVDAPEARALGEYTTSAGTRDEWTDIAQPNRFYRLVGGAWNNAATYAGSYLGWTWAVPFWARWVSRSDYSGRWEVSSNAKDWNDFPIDVTSPAVYLTHVGLCLERGTTSASTGQVVEIDSFTVEPW